VRYAGVDMHLRTIKDKSEINKYFNWADGMICKGLEGGAVDVTISRHDPVRNWLQNRKFHAMIADINAMGVVRIPSRTIRLKEYDAGQCKALLVIWFCNEKAQAGEELPNPPRSFECPITGQQISIRPSTTEWGKKLTCEFVEWLYSFGAHYGVTWSEQSIKQYQSYREAQ
jgi:hypothetical protein